MDVCLSTRNVSQAWAQATRGYSRWGEGVRGLPRLQGAQLRCGRRLQASASRLPFDSTQLGICICRTRLSLSSSLPLALLLCLPLPLYVPRFVRNYDKKRFYLGLYLPPTLTDKLTDGLPACLALPALPCLTVCRADSLAGCLLPPSTSWQPIIFVVLATVVAFVVVMINYLFYCCCFCLNLTW